MRFTSPGVCGQVHNLLVGHPNFRWEQQRVEGGYTTILGEYGDGLHFIELQLTRETATDRCSLAARFSLCSYNSIDSIFIELVSSVLASFEADVWLMTSAVKMKTNYLPGDTHWLVSSLPEEIAAMRAYWQNLFGAKQGAVRVNDSFSFVGAVK